MIFCDCFSIFFFFAILEKVYFWLLLAIRKITVFFAKMTWELSKKKIRINQTWLESWKSERALCSKTKLLSLPVNNDDRKPWHFCSVSTNSIHDEHPFLFFLCCRTFWNTTTICSFAILNIVINTFLCCGELFCLFVFSLTRSIWNVKWRP